MITRASALDLRQTISSEDGRNNPTELYPITELPVGDPDATMPSAGPESSGTLTVIRKPDLPLDVNSKISRPASMELG